MNLCGLNNNLFHVVDGTQVIRLARSILYFPCMRLYSVNDYLDKLYSEFLYSLLIVLKINNIINNNIFDPL